jgi:ribosomal protein S12 methylthiotransferase
MVVFPGEDAKAFATLRQFVIDAQFDWMGAFVYSREEGTKAYRMRGEKEHDGIHAPPTGEERTGDHPGRHHPKSSETFVGRTFPVLLEEEVNGRTWPSDGSTARRRRWMA